MESSILKDAIDRILDLAKPTTMEVGNQTLCSKPMYTITPQRDLPERAEFNTLTGLVDTIRHEGALQPWRLFVRVVSASTVVVYTAYTEWDKLHPFTHISLYRTVADVPRITTDTPMSHEQAIVELRSLYLPGADREYLLDLLSTMSVGEEITSDDNGVTQTATVKQGVQLKATVPVRPIVTLQPFRTFLEVEQPCSDFLLRVGSKGEIALRDADGGAWKLDAKRKIAAWLAQALRPEIEAGKVVVMI